MDLCDPLTAICRGLVFYAVSTNKPEEDLFKEKV
jgi:hypothetical protein